MGTGAGEVFGMVPVQRLAKILGHFLCDVIPHQGALRFLLDR